MADVGLRAVYTLRVADVDTTCDRLASQGLVLLNGPVDRPWGIRSASLLDPSGHCREIACDLAPSQADEALPVVRTGPEGQIAGR